MSKPLEIDEESLGQYIKAHLIDHRFHNSNENPSEIQIAEIDEYEGIPVRFLVQGKSPEPANEEPHEGIPPVCNRCGGTDNINFTHGGEPVCLSCGEKEYEESLNDDSRPERASEHTAPDATVNTSDGGKPKSKRTK